MFENLEEQPTDSPVHVGPQITVSFCFLVLCFSMASSLVYFSSMECSGSGTFFLNSSSRCFNSSRAVFLNLARTPTF